MKIFNYSTGTKGDQIGESSYRSPGAYIGYSGKTPVINEWFNYSQQRMSPANYDTDAVIFCTGKQGDDWQWLICIDVGVDPWKICKKYKEM